MNETSPGSDAIYKRLYSFAEMVADLLLSVLPASTFETLDLRSLERCPPNTWATTSTSAAARDVRDLFAPTGPALAPYQPSQRYILLDERHAEADYAGQLTSAVAKLEQSRSPEDLMRLADVLAKLIDRPDQEGLRRTFADWLRVLYRRLQGPDEPAPPPKLTLEEVRMTLEERVARWPDQWTRQGMERGKREQLRRLAEVRFGAQTAERLLVSVRREHDPQQLDAIAEAVVRCETGDELLRQASRRT